MRRVRSRTRSGGFVLIGLLLALAWGCADGPSEDPRLRRPLLVFEVEAVEAVLGPVAALSGTPAARFVASIRAELDGCRLAGFLLERAPEDEMPRPACLDAANADHASRLLLANERRGEAQGLLLWPVGDDGRLELRLTTTPRGDLVLDGTLHPADDGVFDLLVPSEEDPAAPVLRAADTIVYSRLRPEAGLQLSRLVPEGGQADRMFALKGRLLEGALLRGTVELGILPADAGSEMPLAIGVLHHRGEGPIRAALDEALDQLEATWPIVRTPRTFDVAGDGRHDGACFETLPLLPELAPCWVVTPEALVIAWHAGAIETALGPPAVTSGRQDNDVESTADRRALTVDLARMARSDRRLADPADEVPHVGDLFARLTVDLAKADAGVGIRARLERKVR